MYVMGADVLVTQGAGASAYMILIVLIMLSRNNSYYDYIPSSMYVICLFYFTLEYGLHVLHRFVLTDLKYFTFCL